MSNEEFYRIPKEENCDVQIGNSLFRDNVWDLSPYISQKSMSPSRKKLKFEKIKSPQIRFTVKQYMGLCYNFG